MLLANAIPQTAYKETARAERGISTRGALPAETAQGSVGTEPLQETNGHLCSGKKPSCSLGRISSMAQPLAVGRVPAASHRSAWEGGYSTAGIGLVSIRLALYHLQRAPENRGGVVLVAMA